MLKLILFLFTSSVAITLSLHSEIETSVIATCDVLNRSGLTCRDCNTLSRCVLMNNVWHSYDVDKCDMAQGFYCNSFEQQCSNSTGPCNRLAEFTCSSEGYFPNPFTCQEYNICLRATQDAEIVPYQRFCESGTAYSVATSTCTLKLDHPSCLDLQWQCQYPGDLGLWPGSDDIFYLCLRNAVTDELIPELHKCVDNQIFDGVNCVNRSITSPLELSHD